MRPEYHSQKGPLKTFPFFSLDPLKEMMLDAAVKDLGYKQTVDINGGDCMGFTALMGTTRNGERYSSAHAFLNTIKDRENLHIIKNALVTNVRISDSGIAEGVNFVLNDKKFEAVSKKEVILSGGAINSPQILMNSGVGPKAHLESLKIPVIKDLPVGGNLQDHAIIYLPIKFHKGTAESIQMTDFLDSYYMFLTKRIGSLTYHGMTDLTAFINTLDKNAQYPDIQYHFIDYRRGEEEKLSQFMNVIGYTDTVKRSMLRSIAQEEMVLVGIVLLNPKSKGKIELRSNDPFDKPKIYANYLEEQEDVEKFIRGIRKILEFFQTKTFKEHKAKLHHVNIPQCKTLKFDSDAYWECYTRHLTTTVYHPVGTCKMGPDSDPEAVVDSRLRIKGVKGLRVIDASIMPDIVSGNTFAATTMIGEKGSDFIKEDWQTVKDEL
jgi:choline dehydrogenase-like flavoprotein